MLASACALVGPTCLIERATNIRQSGRFLASTSPATNRSAIAPNEPSFLVKNSDLLKSLSVRENKSPSSTTNLSANSAAAAS